MSKKSNKPLNSQTLGIIWFSIGLLIIAGIAFFSHLSGRQPNEDTRSTATDSIILTQKEDSVYASRRVEKSDAKRRMWTKQDRDSDKQRSREHYATKELYYDTPTPQRKQPLTVELNSADSLTLQLLHGIGPAYARRIVRYRERLGGFVSTDQLLEVYGFTPELLTHIRPHITLDTTVIKPISINSIGLKELSRHPYIEYYQARDIITLRRKGVTFSSADDLRAVPSMADSTLRRILPYLDFGLAEKEEKQTAQ